MRKLTNAEQNKIKVLTKYQVPFTLIEPTETGLKKSIMDATGAVRNYLEEENIHNYALQLQGPKNKVLMPAVIYEQSRIIKSKASLYRPLTKNGDPRIWFYGLSNFAEPNDIVAIIHFDGYSEESLPLFRSKVYQ